MTNLIHPFTGLRAIGVTKSGKIIWPVLGGDESEEAKAAAAKVVADAAAQAAKDKADADANSGKNFTPEQQAQVDKILGERLAREASKYTDYDKFKAAAEELEKIKAAGMTDSEKAIKAAVDKAVADTRNAVLAETAGQRVEASFIASAAGRLQTEALTTLLTSLDKKAFLKDGEVDNDKVKSLIDSIAPASAEDKKVVDNARKAGQGGDGNGANAGSTATGAAKYAERHAKKTA